MLVLALSPYVVGGLVVAFLAISVVLILTVLIQRPTGGGLSGAFGSGAGSGQTAFGAKTGDVLTIVTIVVFGVWILGAIGLNFATRPPDAPVQNTLEAGLPDGTDPAAAEDAGDAQAAGDDQTADDDEPGAEDGDTTQPDDAPPPDDAPAGDPEDGDG